MILTEHIPFKVDRQLAEASIKNNKPLIVSGIIQAANKKNQNERVYPKGILEREDNSSMASSIELRVPFLDHRLVEFAATIPNKFKIHNIAKKISLTSDLTSEVYDLVRSALDLEPMEVAAQKGQTISSNVRTNITADSE